MPTTSDAPAGPALGGGSSAFDFAHYEYERYLGPTRRSRALSAYYAVKPLIPRSAQLALRRRYARRQSLRAFPAWPIEPILVDAFHDQLRATLRADRVARTPFVGFWPAGYGSAVILTHDVEGEAGFANIERLTEIERRHGFRSSWNFVAEDYTVPAGCFERLRDGGFEIGLHGIKHDGKLFQSRARFEADLPKIHQYLAAWNAAGFRSPATHRRADWMGELGCLYDSSYPDTDPFEPQPGGCCSILPFFFGDVVELPITMPQDHTLWEILRERTTDVWRRKAAWIIANHGLVLLNTHPDYFVLEERFERYEELVAFLAAQPDCWRALPAAVATWWKERRQWHCQCEGETVTVGGVSPDRGSIWWAREERDEIVIGL